MQRTFETLLQTLPFTWLGMVVAISFIETPLKFRAPGVTLEIGLGIGRLVFHVLHAVELVFAAVIAVACGAGLVNDHAIPGAVATVAALVAVGALLTQVFVLRPRMDARLDARLAGTPPPPSRHHVAYIVLETLKLVAVATLGINVALAVGGGA